ncbi:LolA-like protein [Ferruginibacter albus]|uniref:hypothetical protein n=1 Tax=Ferruginibacter albus TaxID=2875540 RepID=UPI001CC3379F|nr:hypothetical protein [Ferruginibacter albus]UAY52713.1 hypothetical protein K9M53_03230 [Ferruginibacter albus]
MKNLILLGLLVILLVSVQFSKAQTADDIIAKNIEARGGKDKLASIKTIYMEGVKEMMGNEITVKVTKEQGKLSRTEFEMGSTTGFILVTDKGAWSFIPMRSSAPEQMPADAAAALQTELDITAPYIDYAAKGNTVELAGKDTLNGNENYKLKLTTATGKIIMYWIDAKTYLLTQSSQKDNTLFHGKRNNSEQVEVETITMYKDYSAVDGIQIPHTIETKSTGGGGRFNGPTTFDKIQLNVPIDPKLYKPE